MSECVHAILDEIRVEVYPDAIEVVQVGLQGPPGTGSGGGEYVHTQSSPATQWTINHNLGRYPHISVLSTGLVELTAYIQHISINQTRVQFSTPTAGLARCS